MADPSNVPEGNMSGSHNTPDSPTNSSGSGSLVEMMDEQLDTHLDKVPKAEVNPDHVAALPTTVEAPAIAAGDSERPTEPDLEDLGWSKDPHIPIPLLEGMTNEELWILVRRFNQSVYHVRSIPPPPGKLDLNISENEEFFPDKLRSTIERLYLTVFLSLMGAVKQVARLRSWDERNRTASFCIVYFVAWFFNLIMPLFWVTLIALIVHPPTRRAMFPPAPLALHNISTGEKQTPQAGYLASGDSLTGAAEAYKGQAAEQEAANFVTGFTSIAVGTATGQGAPSTAESLASESTNPSDDGNPENDPPTAEVGDALPDPTSVVGGAANAKATSFGEAATVDKTKKPVEKAMWAQAGPIMHAIATASDMWERFGNALSPTPPFAQNTARLRLAGAILPLFLVSLVLNERLIYRSLTFGLGVGMFGQPVFDRMDAHLLQKWLDEHYPHWTELLDLRNTLLLGVPTNAQLTITLLRIGEANRAPLPPPPPPGEIQAPDTPVAEDAANIDLDHEAIQEQEELEAQQKGDSNAPKKKSSKFVGFIKGTAKATVRSALGADRIKATVGSEQSRLRKGVTGKKGERDTDGPSVFTGRHHGRKGDIVISAAATPPCISFAKNVHASGKNVKPVFSIAVDDIAELRKIGGFGWKGKMIVGWALGTEVADGLEITDKMGGVERLTAMPRRDEVFNRLLTLSHKQHWESL